MSGAVTAPEPSVRRRFSSSTFSEDGSRATSKRGWSALRRKTSYSRPPTASVPRASKLFCDIPPVNQTAATLCAIASGVASSGGACASLGRAGWTAPRHAGCSLGAGVDGHSGREFDAALACTLAAQQRLVAGRQQLRVGHPGSPLGDADRGADARRQAEGGHLREALQGTGGGLGGGLQVGGGEDHRELVPPVAGDAVEGAELALQRVRDLAQQRVP